MYNSTERRLTMSKKKSRLFYDNRFVLLAFGASAALMLIVYLCTQVFPFGGNTMLRMDLYHQYGPLFSELYDKIFSKGSLQYSWESGLGSCFLGNYFNYLSSPIGAIVVFFGHSHVPEAIAAMLVIKTGLAASTFTWYLKKSQHSQSPASLAFGILYSFCAYMLAYYWNIMWIDAMVLLPVILLGIERIIKNGKVGLYIGALALSLFSNYYTSYMLCIFAVIYFIYYSIISDCEKGKAVKRFFKSGFRFAAASLLAAGLMAFALIPTYKVLQSCSATSGSFPEEIKTYFTFFDFFANHFGSLSTTIRSSGDDVLPNVYCGVLTMILAVLYFFTKSISKKEKFATIGLLAVFYVSFNFNFLNYIWHGMHFPNDLPYRFSFMYSFILLIMAYKTFLRLKEFSSRQVGLAGAALVFFVFIVEKIKSKNVGDGTIYFTLVFCVFYVLLMTVFKDKRYLKGSLAVLLCICVCSEVIICDVSAFPNSITRESYEGDYDEFRQGKDYIDTVEKDKFYRMELSYLRTRMDNCWFGYNGVSVFSSMAYERLAKLEDHLGLMSNRINSYTYAPQTPVYNLMHAIKYVVNNTTPNILNSKYYQSLTSTDKFQAYSNNYYLPLAYCVDSAVENWNFEKDLTNPDPFAVQNDFFKKATGEKNDVFVREAFEYINYMNVEPFTEGLDQGDFYFSKNDSEADGSATFHLTTKADGNYYVYFYVDGADSKEITVNTPGGTITKSLTQDSLFDIGNFEKGQSITVNVPFEKDEGSLKLHVYRINDEVFQSGYKKLSANTLELTDFSDTAFSGKFTAEKDCILYTSVPYDEGWSITLDGQKVSSDDIVKIGDALIGVKVKKGSHEISFKFETQGLMTGAAISFFSLAVLILLAIIMLIKKRRGPGKKKKVKASVFTEIDNSVDCSVYYGANDGDEKAAQPAPAVQSGEAVEKIDITSPEKDSPEREIFSPEPSFGEVFKEVFAPLEEPSAIEKVTEKEWNDIFGS